MRLLKAYALTAIVGTQTAQGKISSNFCQVSFKKVANITLS